MIDDTLIDEEEFITRLPLRPTAEHESERLHDPLIPLIVSHHAVTDIAKISRQPTHEWVFDTCFEGEAITSPEILENLYDLKLFDYGTRIKGDRGLMQNGGVNLRMPDGRIRKDHKYYLAKLWLFSNLPHLSGNPYPIALKFGITADNTQKRMLLGRKLFRNSGVRMQLHYGLNPSLSLWVPKHKLYR